MCVCVCVNFVIVILNYLKICSSYFFFNFVEDQFCSIIRHNKRYIEEIKKKGTKECRIHIFKYFLKNTCK